jgi:hypothetical protein
VTDHYAECHYAECRYAECRGATKPEVWMLKVELFSKHEMQPTGKKNQDQTHK